MPPTGWSLEISFVTVKVIKICNKDKRILGFLPFNTHLEISLKITKRNNAIGVVDDENGKFEKTRLTTRTFKL